MLLVDSAQEIRARLMNPPNAVEDVPIDLKRKVLTGLLPRADEIIGVVCKHYCTDQQILSGSIRTANVVRPRHVAMFLIYTMTNSSFPSIGRRFGNRDHTTALHGVRKIEVEIQSDKELSDSIDAMRALVRMKVARRHLTPINCFDPREV